MRNELTIISYFHWADWLVFGAVLVATVVAALYGSWRLKQNKNTPSALDYLLMGRQLTLPLFVATMVATWYGGIFAVNEITFNYGIYNFLTQGIFWYAAYLVFAFFVAKRLVRYASFTLPDLTRQMFGPKSSKITALLVFCYMAPVVYVLSLGMFLHMVFGISILAGMILGTLFVGAYSAWGGLRSVVFSDIVQFFVMCLAVGVVVVFSVCHFGGLSFLQEHLPASHFTLTGGESWLNTLIWGFIAFSTLIDPSFYQRCFAARSPEVVKKGILISTLIWFLFDFCTTTGSLYARAVLPQAQPGQAYFFYAIQLLPVGLRGFFAAGILSIILSTLNSFLFIAANTLSFDLLRAHFKDVVLSNRIAIFAVGAFSIVMAMFFHGSFKEIWLVLGSYFSACLLVPILMGYVSPDRISDRLFVLSTVLSALAMTVWHLLPDNQLTRTLDSFYVGIMVSLVVLLIGRKPKNAAVSHITDW